VFVLGNKISKSNLSENNIKFKFKKKQISSKFFAFFWLQDFFLILTVKEKVKQNWILIAWLLFFMKMHKITQ